MKVSEIKQNMLLQGAIFPEQVQVVLAVPMGSLTKLICKGLTTGKLHDPVLSDEQIAQLEIISSEEQPFDGDSKHFRIGIEALRLGLAYEYDPYFSLSIARVDPLPHQ